MLYTAAFGGDVPIEFSTSLDLDLLYARWSGFVTFDEFKATFASYLSDAHYKPGRRELIDGSRLSDFDINFKTARAALRIVNAQAPGIQVKTQTVLWVPNEEIYGLGRMYQQLAELEGGIQVHLFDQEEDALDALGLPCRTVESLLSEGNFLPPSPTQPRKSAT